MGRGALIVIGVCTAVLLAWGAWATRAPDLGAARAHLERTGRRVDLAEFAGLDALLDPAAVLPATHHHARGPLAAVLRFGRTCEATAGLSRALSLELKKALVWHRAACGHAPLPRDFHAAGPPMHPMGRSYGWLARQRGLADGPLHALERPGAFGDLGPEGLRQLRAGAWLIVSPRFVWVRTGGGDLFGPAGTWRVHERSTSAESLARANVGLAAAGDARCLATPPVSAWCYAVRRPRAGLYVAAGVGALLALFVGLGGLARRLVSERRAHDEQQRFVLRTLTHELRTPATAIGLALEPLRQHFDALPDACQAATLRLADDTARLRRVLALTSRWVRARPDAVVVRPVPSVEAWLRGVIEPFGGVLCQRLGDDRPAMLDVDALALCVSNLVANALQHGRAPVAARLELTAGVIRIRVTDAGVTQAGSLASMVTPFERADQSKGLGLGLSLVARLVGRMGGRLTHTAQPTTFTLEVPA